jgi:hypothetical protein
MNEINFENIENNLENSEKNEIENQINSEIFNINSENENTENINQSENVNTETQETQETQEIQQEQQEPKRRRGRPRKTETQTQTETQDNKSEFFNDLTNQENINKQFEPLETENETITITPIDLKQSLLFLDNLICNTLRHVLHKKIEPMTEEEAEFLASLAPPDLHLLKPSKTTFFIALAGYYVLKLF